GRVHDVDPPLLAGLRVGPADRGVLREDGDAAFLLDVVAVHHPVGQDRALVERARLLQQLVDEGGLAVVDVGDDGDIAEAFDGHVEGLWRCSATGRARAKGAAGRRERRREAGYYNRLPQGSPSCPCTPPSI